MGVSVWTCECAAELKLIHDELDEEEKGYEYRMTAVSIRRMKSTMV